MLRSMTGYGRGDWTQGDMTVTVEIKSVNNRYRDIVLRLPKTLQPLEDEVKALAVSRVRRGRVEVLVQFERKNGQMDYALDLNLPLARSYYGILSKLCEEFGLKDPVSVQEICQMKDVISYKPEELKVEEVREGLSSAMETAVDSWDTMRLREGQAIYNDLSGRIQVIRRHLDRIEESAPLVLEEYRKKLRDRIQQVIDGVEMDQNRLAQEAVLFSDRSDITEEVVRTRSHLDQFEKATSLDEAVGRKLDFIIQEIFREVNTMGSKASDASISAMAVEIKVELEKIREQIQNVE